MEDNFEEAKMEIDKIKRFVPCTLDELLAMDIKDYPFLVEKIVPEKSITVVSGHPESGKTWFIMHLIYCVAYEQPLFAKYKTKKANILLVDEEGGKEEVAKRFKLLGFKNGTEVRTLSQQGITIDNQNDVDILVSLIKEHNAGLLIIDPFGSAFSGEENSARDIRKVMFYLQRIITETGATIIFVHHHRKDSRNYINGSEQSMRGSSAIFGRVDSHIIIKRKKDIESDGEILMIVSQHKSRKGKSKIKSFNARMLENNGVVRFEFLGEEARQIKLPKAETAKELVLKKITENKISFNELYELVKDNVGRDALGLALKELIHDGKINFKKEKHGKPFYWKITQQIAS